MSIPRDDPYLTKNSVIRETFIGEHEKEHGKADDSKQIVQIEKGYIDRLESSISQICKALSKIIDSHHASLGECFDEIKKLEHDLQEYKDKHARDMAREVTKEEESNNEHRS